MNSYYAINNKKQSHSTGANIDRRSSENGQYSVSQSRSMRYQLSGSPTREHWKLDKEADQCEMNNCDIAFSLFERRHHCRKCGDIFCSGHSSNYFRLDSQAEFHTDGTLCRGCDTCAKEYTLWRDKLINSREETHRNNRRMSAPPKRVIMIQQPQEMEGVVEIGREGNQNLVSPSSLKPLSILDVVQPRDIIQSNKDKAFQPIPSVPADWQWSTF